MSVNSITISNDHNISVYIYCSCNTQPRSNFICPYSLPNFLDFIFIIIFYFAELSKYCGFKCLLKLTIR